MDIPHTLETIHNNLAHSTSELRVRWEKIFLEYDAKILSESPEKAEEYLAIHMSELDSAFQLYYVALADVLSKRGLKEAAESQLRMQNSFLKVLKDYKISRDVEIVKSATELAVSISNNFKK